MALRDRLRTRLASITEAFSEVIPAQKPEPQVLERK